MDTDILWQRLERAMRARDVPTFTALIVDTLQERKIQFKHLQQGVIDHCVSKVRPPAAPAMVPWENHLQLGPFNAYRYHTILCCKSYVRQCQPAHHSKQKLEM